jgi:hypothetical protein
LTSHRHRKPNRTEGLHRLLMNTAISGAEQLIDRPDETRQQLSQRSFKKNN